MIVIFFHVNEAYIMQELSIKHLKYSHVALAGEAQWIECWPVNQRVAGSIPSQGMCLG